MTILVSIDDTDNLNSRGTGRLARAIANTLAGDYPVYGVTRHQLYMHPRYPLHFAQQLRRHPRRVERECRY